MAGAPSESNPHHRFIEINNMEILTLEEELIKRIYYLEDEYASLNTETRDSERGKELLRRLEKLNDLRICLYEY